MINWKFGGLAAIVAAMLIVAGCGSSSSNSSSSSAQSSAPAASGGSSSSGVKVSTAHGSLGTYLTGPSGRALYLWVADPGHKSVCSGACAKAWPPLTTSGQPVAASGVKSADLGTIKRSDGQKQVTYDGHPLYYFVADTRAGMITGQGNNGFGAKWWLVKPSGTSITAAAGGSASSSNASPY